MKNVLTIIKKEFLRFFKDKRMVVTIFMPGILIYLLYSLLGNVFTDLAAVDNGYVPSAYVVNMPADEGISLALNGVLGIDDEKNFDEARSAVESGTLDLLIVFPDDFAENYGGPNAPDVAVYYNSSNENSTYGYSLVCALLDAFSSPAFTVNAAAENYDLADEKSTATGMLSIFIPFLMFALLASACVAVAPESIAGEKERGTMATMLITPVKRWQIALGKIISLSCFAMLSGISSFLGVIFSLPKLMGGLVGAETAAFYSAADYFMILGTIISIVLVIISLFAVLSALAKSVKEAAAFISPLMIVIILLGVVSIFFKSEPALWLYSIPLLGSGLALSGIMSLSVSGLAVALSVISNLVVAALLTVLLGFMFKSERIMFNK